MAREYRDRIYIRKDILLKLYEFGELNQSKLMSICGLNNAKHKGILDDMIEKGILELEKEPWGNKVILKYKISEKGIRIMKEVLDPYEEIFPRGDKNEK